MTIIIRGKEYSQRAVFESMLIGSTIETPPPFIIDSIADLSQAEEIFREECNKEEVKSVYFRGQGKSYPYKAAGSPVCSSVLRPSAMRGYRSAQKDIFHEGINFINALQEELGIDPRENVLDNLCVLQHYGYPTPLLDVTKNILVSAYFAAASNLGSDGIVFFIGSKKHWPNNSQEISFRSNLTQIPIRQIVALSTLAFSAVQLPQPPAEPQYFDSWVDEMKRKYSERFKRAVGFRSDWIKILKLSSDEELGRLADYSFTDLASFVKNDLCLNTSPDLKAFSSWNSLFPLPVEATENNERLRRQEGAFLLYGLQSELSVRQAVRPGCGAEDAYQLNKQDEIDRQQNYPQARENRPYIRFAIIKKELKHELLSCLDKEYGINRLTLGLEGKISSKIEDHIKSIQDKYYVRPIVGEPFRRVRFSNLDNL